MAEPTGISAVLDDLAPQDLAPVDDGEQLDLLGLPDVRVGSMVQAYRGRGRPPGSRNKRTVAWADYLLARYASPLEVLAQIATAPVASLAAQLGCKPLEALAEKRQAAIALAPFLHQRMPVSVDVTDRKVVHLTIVEAGADAAAPVAEGVTARVVEVLENQRVEDEPDATV